MKPQVNRYKVVAQDPTKNNKQFTRFFKALTEEGARAEANLLFGTTNVLSVTRSFSQNFNDQEPGDFSIVRVSSDLSDIMLDIANEIYKAEEKHPGYVDTLADALLVIGEEAGEAQRAFINAKYHYEGYEEVRKELVQTATTVFRALLNLDRFIDDEKGRSLKTAKNDPFGDIGNIINHICNPNKSNNLHNFFKK